MLRELLHDHEAPAARHAGAERSSWRWITRVREAFARQLPEDFGHMTEEDWRAYYHSMRAASGGTLRGSCAEAVLHMMVGRIRDEWQSGALRVTAPAAETVRERERLQFWVKRFLRRGFHMEFSAHNCLIRNASATRDRRDVAEYDAALLCDSPAGKDLLLFDITTGRTLHGKGRKVESVKRRCFEADDGAAVHIFNVLLPRGSPEGAYRRHRHLPTTVFLQSRNVVDLVTAAVRESGGNPARNIDRSFRLFRQKAQDLLCG